jgi:hypothetical protein
MASDFTAAKLRKLSRELDAKKAAGKKKPAPKKKATPRVKGMKVKVNPATRQRKLHAGRYVHDQAYDEDQHDCGPWIEVNSTRCRDARYDYQNEAVQVRWVRNGAPYIYLEVPYERFRAFIRSSSKGRFINSDLNNYDKRPATPEELDAPSSETRKERTPAGASTV